MEDKKLTIAIVGNSPILLNEEYGDEIDQHDVVIRFNNFVIDGYEKHTGKKTTDICFNPYTKRNDEILKLPKEHRLFFYTSETNESLSEKLYEKYGCDLTINDVTIIDNEKYYKELCKKLQAKNNWQGSSGLIMCQKMADEYPNAQIDVYGITFFKDTIEAKEGERYNKIHHLDGSIVDSGHDHNAEWKYYETYLRGKINLHL